MPGMLRREFVYGRKEKKRYNIIESKILQKLKILNERIGDCQIKFKL